MSPYTYIYSPRAERMEARRAAALDLLTAVAMAMVVGVPLVMWWSGA